MSKSNHNRILKIAAVLAVIAVLACGVYAWKQYKTNRIIRISYTAFIDKVNSGEIVKARMQGDEITAEAGSGAQYQLFRPADADTSKLLLARHIDLSAKPAGSSEKWFLVGTSLVMLAPFFFILKRLATFNRSKAKLSDGARSQTFFTDVAGVEEAKLDLLDTVEFLKDPKRFARLGGKMPTGMLLVGPPGTGKTLLARAVAGEARVPFFSLSASEFVELYVGVGASRVRDLFSKARKSAPCIIFIDELDAVGRKRSSVSNGASDERDQTLNQLLVEMDGFSVNPGIVVIAATNRPEILDQALLRPGRFDRQVAVGAPDIRGREEILKVHTRTVPLGQDVDLRIMARGTPGFSGADLANVVNEAAILAARSDKRFVEMADFESAKDKVLMGAEKKSMVLTDKVKLSTAWHEAGHVMVAKLVPGCEPVHKVSIIPRGRALGVTVQIPEEDIHCYTREMLVCHIKVLMGGRAAEDLVYRTTTTGAGNDLARATEMARKMVCEWGMSEAFGPVAFGHNDAAASTETGSSNTNHFSDATALEIDSEIRSIVTSCYTEVRNLLEAHMDVMKRLVGELVISETLSDSEIDAIIGPLHGAAGPR